MELPEARDLIRDLDLTLQPRSAPRYKIWLPLATQQLRLRNLIQVIGFNLKTDKTRGKEFFYYTLHHANMSSPLYTSEPIDDANPKWASLEVPVLYATGHSAASDVVLRIWKKTVDGDTQDTNVMAWNLSLTGLAYLGTKLPPNLENVLHENALIFHLYGGFFVPPRCCLNPPDLKRYLAINVGVSEAKDSYTVNKLCSLRSKMQALKQQSESARMLREKIALGYYSKLRPFSDSSLNRFLYPTRENHEKKAESMRIRKELEIARFRAKLLDQERIRKIGEIRVLSQLHASIAEENQDHGSYLMGKYRELNRDIERLREWRQGHIEIRDVYVRTTARLARRRKQLISELNFIYPISRMDNGKYSINNVHLPDSEDLESCNDTQVAVALGSVTHTTQMIANFLNIPMRYPVIHCASRSKVIDHITENIPDKDRQFPLFARGKDKLQFHYAVYLLNKNIAQLRWYCGLPTVDLRATLPNLASLMNMKPTASFDSSGRTFSGSSLDTMYNIGKKQPSTSSFDKVIFEKCHVRSKSNDGCTNGPKSVLGASLDQGLNTDTRLLMLSKKTRRMCKSEDDAITDETPMIFYNNAQINDDGKVPDYHTYESNASDNRRAGENATGASCVIPIEANIEILVPVSVTQQKGESVCQENSVGSRHRSSNSVSSCEMALCANHVDGEDIWTGEVPNYEESVQETFTNDETFQLPHNQAQEVDSQPFSDKTESLNKGTSEFPQNRTWRASTSKMTDEVDGCESVPGEKPHEGVDLSVRNQPMSIESCSFMNDAMEYASSIMERKKRAGSVCSFPEEYLIPERVLRRKRYDSESREDGSETQRFLESWRTSGPTVNSDDQLQHLKFDQGLNKGSLMSTPLSVYHAEKENPESSDPQASSEYIDSIRRSSETVFARTEALANKQTSFKVMKPRQ